MRPLRKNRKCKCACRSLDGGRWPLRCKCHSRNWFLSNLTPATAVTVPPISVTQIEALRRLVELNFSFGLWWNDKITTAAIATAILGTYERARVQKITQEVESKSREWRRYREEEIRSVKIIPCRGDWPSEKDQRNAVYYVVTVQWRFAKSEEPLNNYIITVWFMVTNHIEILFE